MNWPAPTKYWLGFMVPVSASDEARLYWETDIPAAEIIEAFAPGLHPNQISSLAGDAFTPFVCEQCDSPVSVGSRSRAQDLFGRERRVARSKWRYERDTHSVCCDACRQAERDRVSAPYRIEHERRQRRERELRYMPYAEYLKTPEWAATRQTALKRARYSCQTCAAGGQLHVHHRTYIRRGAEYASDLIVLCAGCHGLFHQHGKLAEGGRAA